MSELKIAGVQMDIAFGDITENMRRIEHFARQAASSEAELVVFPECSLSGYCFANIEEARKASVALDGREIATLQKLCKSLRVHLVVGLLELDGSRVHNTVVCLGPSGVIGRYRKIHLPYLGVDRFTTPGNRLEVFDVLGAKIGMNICYDSVFPEASRVLMLQGADVIILPTNWPTTSGRTADFIPNARALENNVYFVAVNRVGTEQGFSFIGRSRIVDPRGNDLAAADHTDEEILFATIDPQLARQKRIVNIPGEHEIDRLNDRRPASYQLVTKTMTGEAGIGD
ncbi:MAG: carbon-nitrogen hydrolase family protein [Pirellulaceae bacterium]|jgi:5-aminopentanamidase|nr:carbon-nitrogen hydrolase family protein [Pirellulaceae bacterium]